MSVQSEITRIESAKTAIATAIEGKGVTVPEGTKLDGMAALVEAISAGGGDFDFSSFCFPVTKAVSGTFIQSMNTADVTINHGLGITPKIIIVFCTDTSSLIGASKRTCEGAIMIMNRFYLGDFPKNPIDEPLHMVSLNFSLPSPTSTKFAIYSQQYINNGTIVEGSGSYNPFYSSSGSNGSFQLNGIDYEKNSEQRIIFSPYAGSQRAYIVGGVEYTYFAAG